MGLLRTLLIILIIYYGLKFISKYLMPFVFNKTMQKVQKNMKNKFDKEQNPSTNVGETSIEYAPKNESSNNKVGEYIDFEEVDSETKKDK